jgi:hypothetical protein
MLGYAISLTGIHGAHFRLEVSTEFVNIQALTVEAVKFRNTESLSCATNSSYTSIITLFQRHVLEYLVSKGIRRPLIAFRRFASFCVAYRLLGRKQKCWDNNTSSEIKHPASIPLMSASENVKMHISLREGGTDISI